MRYRVVMKWNAHSIKVDYHVQKQKKGFWSFLFGSWGPESNFFHSYEHAEDYIELMEMGVSEPHLWLDHHDPYPRIINQKYYSI